MAVGTSGVGHPGVPPSGSDAGVDLSLVVACYNEASHLEDSVRQVIDTLDRTRWSYELIFIDDCSQDGTRAVIDDLVARYPRHHLRTAHHQKNTGRGRTVTDGLRLARGRVAGFIDIDLEVHARYIPAMVTAIEQGAAVASAHRIYKFVPSLLARHIASRGYHWLTRLLLGISLEDTEAGYKFFDRERILPVLDETHDPGWFWDTEIMARASYRGLEIREIPCLFIRRTDKKSTVRLFRDSFEYFVKLWRFSRSVRHELERRSQASLAP